MNSKGKHNKIKNTGLLYECLLRQVTVDVLNGQEKSKSLEIIKKFFNENTEIGRELTLYNVLYNQSFKSDKKADFLITETVNEYRKLNKQDIRREKYNLIKTIKENYNTKDFLSSRIVEYKVYASIYRLFEYYDKLKPQEKTETYFTILEHITDMDKKNKPIQISEFAKSKEVLRKDEDVRILSYKILLEKFNKKYNSLDVDQKELLRAYINNISNVNSLREYIEDKVKPLKTKLQKKSSVVKDKVVRIKLKECISLLNNFNKDNKNVGDKEVISLMRYYELLKELKG